MTWVIVFISLLVLTCIVGFTCVMNELSGIRDEVQQVQYILKQEIDRCTAGSIENELSEPDPQVDLIEFVAPPYPGTVQPRPILENCL